MNQKRSEFTGQRDFDQKESGKDKYHDTLSI